MGKTIALTLIGAVISVLGIINIKGNVSSIHWYNRSIGGSFIVSAILELVFQTDIFDYLILCGCFVGLAVMLYGQFKYNKGIF